MKKILGIVCCIVIMFSCIIPVSAKSVPSDSSFKKLMTSEAMKPGNVKKQIKKTYGTNNIKLDINKPVTINFNDGSSVTYTLTEVTLPSNEELPSATSRIAPQSSLITALSTTRKSLIVTAVYKCLSTECDIMLNANCTWSGRTVTINSLQSGSAIVGGTCYRNTSILEKVGKNNKSACGRCYGQINWGTHPVEISIDFAFREYIDPMNSSSAQLAVEY